MILLFIYIGTSPTLTTELREEIVIRDEKAVGIIDDYEQEKIKLASLISQLEYSLDSEKENNIAYIDISKRDHTVSKTCYKENFKFLDTIYAMNK